MTKTFTIAGVSTVNGKQKFNVANGSIAAREKSLAKAGQSDIRLIELPNPMDKQAAIAYVAGLAEFASVQPTAKGGVAPKAKTPQATKKAA